MAKGTQDKARYGLYVKPHGKFAQRTWYFSESARDAEYRRAKDKCGPEKTSKTPNFYVKKVQR